MYGFDVEDLVELYAPDEAQTHEYYSFVTADWARKWPAERYGRRGSLAEGAG